LFYSAAADSTVAGVGGEAPELKKAESNLGLFHFQNKKSLSRANVGSDP